jgi:hypothetical protein
MKRFFYFFFQNWTYEIRYGFEIGRIAVQIVIDAGLLLIRPITGYPEGEPAWVTSLLVMIFLCGSILCVSR